MERNGYNSDLVSNAGEDGINNRKILFRLRTARRRGSRGNAAVELFLARCHRLITGNSQSRSILKRVGGGKEQGDRANKLQTTRQLHNHVSLSTRTRLKGNNITENEAISVWKEKKNHAIF
ncbi:hypothetical protein NPIL_451681 [Nephila pilipes]|uniref:Uncharacterized protein n=1 Tax=Nephila pilipes TaxID=299642 RepID=A0A8X6NAL7_NEPPI|nr:hypothetical protein NPIL_451681 [Nephila pilipes]